MVAYCGPAPHPGDLLGRWNLDPWLIAALVLAAWLVNRSVIRERRMAFGGALLCLVVAFVSPLCALSSALFAARTVHHVLIVAVAAPLLAFALPPTRERGVFLPLAASTLTLWFWHVPSLYTAALNSIVLYWVMQLSLLGSALWFWRTILSAQAAMPMALLSIAAAIGQMGFLGALLTFAPRALYPHHLIAPFAYGLTPLQDQQLAGLIMWVPAMLPYAVIAGWLARRAWSRSPAYAA